MNTLKFVGSVIAHVMLAAICFGIIAFVVIEVQDFVSEVQHTLDTATSALSNLPVR